MIDLDFRKVFAESRFTLDISLHIKSGEFTSIFGKSGSGKTTLLRILAGLTLIDSGFVKVKGAVWSDSRIYVKPQKRNIGYVFQDHALFPNMTVKENLMYGFDRNVGNPAVIPQIMDVLHISDLASRKPSNLSGGEKQRVALARAVVRKPDILLLDEPLASVDHESRRNIQNYIQTIHDQFQLTTIMVSHDIGEIYKLSDRVIEMDAGKIIKSGKPQAIFQKNQLGGKFQFTGEIVAVDKQDFIFIIMVLVGKDMVKVISEESSSEVFSVGDKVILTSKAFNPVIQKII